MESCYARPSALYCGQSVLRSERGVQQGDPCGPAAFAWAVQDLAEDLSAFVTWQAWYFDDAHILGTPLQLHQALQFIRDRAAAIGLELNLAKCQVWGPVFPCDPRRLSTYRLAHPLTAPSPASPCCPTGRRQVLRHSVYRCVIHLRWPGPPLPSSFGRSA